MSLRVPLDDLQRHVRLALERAGMPTDSAAIEARIMCEADLLGTPSHGVRMLPALLVALADGRVNPTPQVNVSSQAQASCVIDGDRGAGRHISLRAMQEAMARAEQFGVGVAAANRTSHWGRAHAYAAHAAAAGYIGLCMTNAIPNMAAYGAAQRVLGNNPLAIGAPAVNADEPVVLDMAMSQAAVGKVSTWLREGRAVPPGWGVNARGEMTTDPREILSGAVLPMGDHKGAGLSLMIELMTAALAGGLFSHEVAEEDRSGIDPGSCKLFIAIKIAALTDLDQFRQRSSDVLGFLTSNTPPGQFLAPSQRGWQERKRNLDEGVPVHQEIVDQLRAAGIDLGG